MCALGLGSSSSNNTICQGFRFLSCDLFLKYSSSLWKYFGPYNFGGVIHWGNALIERKSKKHDTGSLVSGLPPDSGEL